MRTVAKHTRGNQLLQERLSSLEQKGKKYKEKGIQYNPHDLPKNTFLRFCMFENMNCTLAFAVNPISPEIVPISMLRDVIVYATKIPSKVVFIMTALYSSNGNGKHANLIVYNKPAKRIELFDPLGCLYAGYEEQRNLQDSIICDVMKDRKVKYYPETIYTGIQCYDQIIDCKREGTGFCAIWTCLVAKLCVEFPHKTLRQIVQEITETQQHCSANLCRGFLDEMREDAVEMMNKLGKKFSKQYLEFCRMPISAKAKSKYTLSETVSAEYIHTVNKCK